MIDFYRLRLGKHQKKMMKYLKYVFNDHFILVCMFGVGAFGYYYSNFVKTLDMEFFYGSLIVCFIWLVSLKIGKVATLLQEADKVFLLPKERNMISYLKYSIRYSFVVPAISLALITAVTMPILVATTEIVFNDFIFFMLTLWLLKGSDLLIQMVSFYLNTEKLVMYQRIIWGVISVSAVILDLFFVKWSGMILALLYQIVMFNQTKKWVDTHQLDWEKGIKSEKKRMKRIYTFINLFTDVPGLSSDIKRRQYADVLLNKIKKDSSQTYFYLYTRVFIRGAEYSGLVVRLTLIGILVLFFSSHVWLSIIISGLFVYLLGFQLIPIYGEFDYMVMTALYPIPIGQKKDAVKRLIRDVLFIVVVLFGATGLYRLPSIGEAGVLIGVLLVEWLGFTMVYVPKRLKKMEKNVF